MNKHNNTTQLVESKEELINTLYDLIKELVFTMQYNGLSTDRLQKYITWLQEKNCQEGEKALELLRKSIRLQAMRGISQN